MSRYMTSRLVGRLDFTSKLSRAQRLQGYIRTASMLVGKGSIRAQSTAAQVASSTFQDGGRNLQFLENRDGRYLGWTTSRQEPRYHDLVFLRDSCSCSKCVNPSTSQKEFDTTDIPLDINVASLKQLPGSQVEIEWTNDISGFDGHRTVLDLDFWEQSSSPLRRHALSYDDRLVKAWDRESIARVESELYVDYEDYMQSEQTLHKVLKLLRDSGVVFVRGAPTEEKTVTQMAERIGPLQHTFYGETWDVRSVPSAKNVAYTSTNLGFHMDLLYMKDPPGLQYLHVLKQSAQGGESLWADALNAVYTIQRDYPELAPSMWQFPVTYRYKNDGKWFQYSRAMLEGPGMYNVDHLYQTWRAEGGHSSTDDLSSSQAALIWGRHFDAVNWSPPFQGPLLWDAGEWRNNGATEPGLRNYLKMAKVFRSLMEAPENIYETKMEEGTCAIFDNRRTVHARKAFTAVGGERWLKGAYVDGNSFRARLRAFEAGM